MSSCAFCSKPATARCSACQQVSYCSADHQKKHWSAHKEFCGVVKAEKATAAKLADLKAKREALLREREQSAKEVGLQSARVDAIRADVEQDLDACEIASHEAKKELAAMDRGAVNSAARAVAAASLAEKMKEDESSGDDLINVEHLKGSAKVEAIAAAKAAAAAKQGRRGSVGGRGGSKNKANGGRGGGDGKSGSGKGQTPRGVSRSASGPVGKDGLPTVYEVFDEAEGGEVVDPLLPQYTGDDPVLRAAEADRLRAAYWEASQKKRAERRAARAAAGGGKGGSDSDTASSADDGEGGCGGNSEGVDEDNETASSVVDCAESPISLCGEPMPDPTAA